MLLHLFGIVEFHFVQFHMENIYMGAIINISQGQCKQSECNECDKKKFKEAGTSKEGGGNWECKRQEVGYSPAPYPPT